VSDDPLDYLFSLEQFGIKFGLDNITALMAAMDHPERAFQSIHVAGTNGKGSVTAMLDSVLRVAGHQTGRYTSPHLVDLAERFVVDGRPVEPQTLRDTVAHVREVSSRLQDAGTLSAPPTFFEATTAAAFEIFRRARVSVAVCEVGLGGRLDATNVLTPVVSAITSIAFDHQQYLGDTLAAIAAEKAGIVKPGIPVVVGDVPEAASETIERIAAERRAPLIRAHEGVGVDDVRLAPDGIDMRLTSPAADYGTIHLSLTGQHQTQNAVVAVRILELVSGLGIAVTPDDVRAGLANVRWPGRLERVLLQDGRELLLDAAHNPAGAAALASYLAAAGAKRPLVFAAMRDKDIPQILRALAPRVGAFIMTRASNPRSADPAELARIARTIAPEVPVTIAMTITEALAAAWAISPRATVAGSIFLLGDVVGWLRRP
jgi:dihydrofolate synthase/folylpolyglutamate synthase